MYTALSNVAHFVFYNVAQWWSGYPLWIPSYGTVDIVMYIGSLLLASPFIYALCERIRYEGRFR